MNAFGVELLYEFSVFYLMNDLRVWMRGILEYYLFGGWKRLSRLELAKILGWVSKLDDEYFSFRLVHMLAVGG